MLIRKKISFGFLISAGIIGILVIFEYINFTQIEKEVAYLELTDTIRSKSLQLRRHEKNYFLFSPLKSREESEAIKSYLAQLESIVDESRKTDKTGKLSGLKAMTLEYRKRFNRIEELLASELSDFNKLKPLHEKEAAFFPIIQTTFYDRPLMSAETLMNALHIPPGEKIVTRLDELDLEVNYLRKIGEDILNTSKELDQNARANVDRGVQISKVALLTSFPLFLVIGIGGIFVITSNVVSRLNLLTRTMEKARTGSFPSVSAPKSRWGRDEVGLLIGKFNTLEEELSDREKELEIKNRELLQNKKLAAIGTLASGVAHELNNPLNNIYLSAQIAGREATNDCPPFIKEIIKDIGSQTLRLKQIVGDLLEFARGKEPEYRPAEINSLIDEAYMLLSKTADLGGVEFRHTSSPEQINVALDYGQVERVFINLFSNAVDAMEGKGTLSVSVTEEDNFVRAKVSDTGQGIKEENMEKIFDPFYSTKDKGTGLGLAIILNIIKKHNGEIRVSSKSGKGTIFEIKLPKNGMRDAV